MKGLLKESDLNWKIEDITSDNVSNQSLEAKDWFYVGVLGMMAGML